MTLWKLEIARLIRTRRIVALVGVYLFFGLTDPITTRYLEKILSWFQSSMQGASLTLPTPTVGAALTQYSGDAAQIGTLVVVIVAAGSVALDRPAEMGVFLRTRVPELSRLLLPRVVVVGVAAGLAQLLGTVAAAYETAILLGPLPWAALAESVLIGLVATGFVVLLVTAFAQALRGTLAVVMASLAALLVIPIFGVVPAIGRWLPTRLLGSLAELSTGTSVIELWPALVVTALLGALCWWTALALSRRREL
jgi:ABC-2 type transport system permease protein